jgi:hypothetical protein
MRIFFEKLRANNNVWRRQLNAAGTKPHRFVVLAEYAVHTTTVGFSVNLLSRLVAHGSFLSPMWGTNAEALREPLDVFDAEGPERRRSSPLSLGRVAGGVPSLSPFVAQCLQRFA